MYSFNIRRRWIQKSVKIYLMWKITADRWATLSKYIQRLITSWKIHEGFVDGGGGYVTHASLSWSCTRVCWWSRCDPVFPQNIQTNFYSGWTWGDPWGVFSASRIPRRGLSPQWRWRHPLCPRPWRPGSAPSRPGWFLHNPCPCQKFLLCSESLQTAVTNSGEKHRHTVNTLIVCFILLCIHRQVKLKVTFMRMKDKRFKTPELTERFISPV